MPAGRVFSTASLRDLPATVADLAGLGERGFLPGPLARAVLGAPRAGFVDLASADPVFAECDKDWLPASDARRVWRSLSSGEMVYIRSASKTEELYRVTTNPAQARNLAATPGEPDRTGAPPYRHGPLSRRAAVGQTTKACHRVDAINLPRGHHATSVRFARGVRLKLDLLHRTTFSLSHPLLASSLSLREADLAGRCQSSLCRARFPGLSLLRSMVHP